MEINGETKICGLIGDPVAHSLSPSLHNSAYRALGLNYRYLPFPVAPAELSRALRGAAALNLAGLNVTAPHKEAVLPLLDHIDADAAAIGAVNTICIRGGRLHGYNTDGAGFLWALREEARWSPAEAGRDAVVILGAGGAARAVAFALAGAGVGDLVILNRTAARAEQLAGALRERFPGVRCRAAALAPEQILRRREKLSLLVNTLSAEPWDWAECAALPGSAIACDLRYHPRVTPFLEWARACQASAFNGLGMLTGQAALSFALFTGLAPPFDLFQSLAQDQTLTP